MPCGNGLERLSVVKDAGGQLNNKGTVPLRLPSQVHERRGSVTYIKLLCPNKVTMLLRIQFVSVRVNQCEDLFAQAVLIVVVVW